MSKPAVPTRRTAGTGGSYLGGNLPEHAGCERTEKSRGEQGAVVEAEKPARGPSVPVNPQGGAERRQGPADAQECGRGGKALLLAGQGEGKDAGSEQEDSGHGRRHGAGG